MAEPAGSPRPAATGRDGKTTASLVYPEFFPVVRSESLLDLGCGTGPQTALYARTARSVVGVEIQPARLALARERLGDRPGAALVRADVTVLPFPGASFDRAIAVDVIEHLDDPAVLLCEARRVLRPSGRLLVTVPALYDRLHAGALGRAVARLKGRGRYFTGALGYDDHRPPRPLGEWERLFRAAGFAVYRSQAMTLFPPLHRYGVPRVWFAVGPLRRALSALGRLRPLRGLGQATMYDLRLAEPPGASADLPEHAYPGRVFTRRPDVPEAARRDDRAHRCAPAQDLVAAEVVAPVGG